MNTHDQSFKKLATLDPVDYDIQRNEAAKTLGIRKSTLDDEVKKHRVPINKEDHDELVSGVDPWQKPVNSVELVEAIEASIKRYCVLNGEMVTATALWLMGAYSINSFRIFPKLGAVSPQKRCGKTTLLEVIGSIAPRALSTSNVTSAVMFRVIEEWQPTLIIDEMDTFTDGNEELRGIVNSGHTKKLAHVMRVEGDAGNRMPKRYSTWAPMVLARIGEFADTIADRCIQVRCQRKLATDTIERLPVDLDAINIDIRRKCQRFSDDNSWRLSKATPFTPRVGNDRAEDNWLPLLAVADIIGGDWPDKARQAMGTIERSKDDSEDLAMTLLRDIQTLITERRWIHSIPSTVLVNALNGLDERPWPTLRNDKGLSAHKLASILKPFRIISGAQRPPGSAITYRGYSIEKLEKVFSQYIPNNNVTTSQVNENADRGDFQNVTDASCVTDSNTLIASNHRDCDVATFENDNMQNKQKMNDATLITDGQTRNTDGCIYPKNWTQSKRTSYLAG